MLAAKPPPLLTGASCGSSRLAIASALKPACLAAGLPSPALPKGSGAGTSNRLCFTLPASRQTKSSLNRDANGCQRSRIDLERLIRSCAA